MNYLRSPIGDARDSDISELPRAPNASRKNVPMLLCAVVVSSPFIAIGIGLLIAVFN